MERCHPTLSTTHFFCSHLIYSQFVYSCFLHENIFLIKIIIFLENDIKKEKKRKLNADLLSVETDARIGSLNDAGRMRQFKNIEGTLNAHNTFAQGAVRFRARSDEQSFLPNSLQKMHAMCNLL